MDPIAKQILNALKCPICQSQVDLVGWQRVQRHDKDSNFACVSVPEHYSVWFPHWDDPNKILRDVVVIYDGHYKHTVRQRYVDKIGTLIQTIEVDPEQRNVDGAKAKSFVYDKLFFDYTKTTKEKLLNKIKTILVFQ